MYWRDRDAQLLPDSSRWGRGYGGKAYTPSEIHETRTYIGETIDRGGLPGYENRGLVHKAQGYLATADNFLLPPGFDAEHPTRSKQTNRFLLEPNNPTSLECDWHVPEYLELYYQEIGAPLDQHGRWVHPLGRQVMEEDIPLCTGYGIGYEGGETVVVDTVVEDGESVLFTTRTDNGPIPSLVGGYTWATDFTSIEKWRVGIRPINHDGLLKSVHRIIRTKAGITLPAEADIQIAWGARPWSSVHTLNFGTLTYTIHVRLPSGMSRHLPPNDRCHWQSKQNIGHVTRHLWPDHRRGYDACMR